MKKIYLILFACFFTHLASSQIWSDDFEDGIGAWTTIDADGDGQNWVAVAGSSATNGSANAASFSWTQATGAITPNNYMISPAIDLTSVTGTILVDWNAYAQDQTWANEHYQVIASEGSSQADIDGGTILYDGIVGASDNLYVPETANISDFAGGMVHITFIHNMVTDQFSLNIDDVNVYTSNITDIGVTKVTSPNHDSGCGLTASENVVAEITNFGGTEVSTFEVSYSINGGTPVTETVTETIAPAGTYLHTFATSVDMLALGEYTVEVSASIADDNDAANDATTLATRSSDAQISVHTLTDAGGGQAWQIVDNTTGEVVASRGAYQWNVEVTDNVCVYSDRCYTFNYIGAMEPGAYLEVLLDGVQVAGSTDLTAGVPAAIDIPALGGGCPDNEVVVTRTTFQRYQVLNEATSITAEVENLGVATITELTANYSVNGGSGISQTFTGLDIAPGENFELSFDTQFPNDVLEVSDVVVTVETVNGEVDDMSNNSQNGTIIAMTEAPDRKFIVEEGTGTWCPWCPRGDVGVNSVTSDHDDAYGIAVHNDDPMDIGSYDSDLIALVNGGGYPFSGINRTFETDPNAAGLEAAYQSEKLVVVPASLDATAVMDSASRELTVDVSAEIFAALMPGDYRINVVLTEDGVTGTGSGYDQFNNYAGNAAGPMGGYENLPNPVPAADMVYNHVARMLMGGFSGDMGSFPSDATNADAPTYQYTTTVPAGWNVENMHAVAMIIDMTSGGQIVNSISTSIDVIVTVSSKDLYQHDLAKIYPNPFSDVTNIELTLDKTENVTVEVMNSVGQRVAFKDYGQLSGNMVLPFDGSNFENGIYFIHIRLDEKLITKKVMLAR